MPPPAAPEVLTVAPESSPTLSPNSLIAPPVSPAFIPEASSVPCTVTVPDAESASRTIVPLWLPTVRASITPVLLTTLARRESLAPALMRTTPPSDWIRPPFSARLLSTPWSICILTRLLL